ncbi:alpha/beta hydrolase [Novosphingobium flavum]|uniref:Alpha/beta hydrolase n=1 Tax=Novosphingobium flavum TaxID=1778672 RepID=A0A7X1KJX3_9SPHN|nr:alpha/beta hydrolase [Novosphingobium flavum]
MTEVKPVTFDRRRIPENAIESRWIAPDGWAVRRLDWAGGQSKRGSLLFVPGRGDFFEKYLETLDHWHQQGWGVTAIDWRGQALSGRLGADSVTGHVDDFALWVGDLAAFWTQWQAHRPGPHVLVAHSMGGHLALRAVAEGRIAPDALVLSAPMLGLITHGLPLAPFHWAAQLMCGTGDPRRPAWKWSEKPGQLPVDRSVLLTHDAARYADEIAWREQRPGLVMGPGSWGWLCAAITSMRGLDRREVLERIETPVFIIAASADKLVGPAAIRRAAGWLPHAELLEFGSESRHEILREVDPVRDKALAAIDDFLDRAAPAGN